MKLLRTSLALVGIAASLVSCADTPKNWTGGDPLDRFDQPTGESQIHGEMGVNSSAVFR